MKVIATERSIPVLQPDSINTPEGVTALQALSPDLLVVAAYGQILSRDVLAVPPLGGINVHASLLPKYRGAAPINWAIYHGETRTGVTIIRMTVGLDAGDTLAQVAVDIGPDETAGDVEARLAPVGARLALDVIGRMAAGPVSGSKQDAALVTKAPKLKKENGLIDWTRTAEQVCNQIRAMQPWPTPYTFLHRPGKPPVRFIVVRAVPAQTSGCASVPPGHVHSGGAGGLYVAAGGGSVVKLLDLQPAGKRAMSAVDFLRGHPLGPDDRFGPESP
jgi:methionyl-tRNA formyltransferase